MLAANRSGRNTSVIRLADSNHYPLLGLRRLSTLLLRYGRLFSTGCGSVWSVVPSRNG